MKLMKFWAPWCSPCKSLGATMEDIKFDIPVESINVDEQPSMMRDYGIRSVPTLLLVNEGNTVIKRQSGNMSRQQLEDFVKTS